MKPARAEMVEEAGGETRARAEPTTQRILVRDLVLTSSVGLSDAERATPQRICLNLEIQVTPQRPRHDRIDEVVNYSSLVRQIRQVFATLDSPRLLETVSGQLADVCLAEPRVEWVRVRLEKLDRYADAASVGLDMLYHAPGNPTPGDH